MVFDKNSVTLKPDYDLMDASFEMVLDMTCERLEERQIRHSIRRIRKMEEELQGLEKDLDEFMGRLGTQLRSTDKS